MFKNPFSKSKPESKENKKFTFIWYKKMHNGKGELITTSKPMRSTISAPTEAEAREKLMDYILGRTEVVIVNEEKFNKDYAKFEDSVDKVWEDFEKVFESVDDIFGKNWWKDDGKES